MTAPGGHEPTSSRAVRSDLPASGTTAGADVTARMAGTHDSGTHTETAVRPTDTRHGVLRAKTSAAATFALVFGLSALFCALTAILAPAAVVFGVLGLVLALVGFKMTKRPGVTGKGLAVGGLVTALLGLLLGAAVIAGASVLVNDERQLDQIQDRLEDLRGNLPSQQEIQDEIPG